MKKFAAAAMSALVLVVTGTAFTEPFQGVYYGGGVGATNYGVRLKLSSSIGNRLEVGEDSFRLGYGLFGGYNYRQEESNLVVGVEGSFEGSAAKTFFPEQNTTLRDGFSSGVALRLGYVLADDTLLYGRVGGVDTRFLLAGDHQNVWGLRLGGGVEHKVSETMSLRGEYTFTNYRFIESMRQGVSMSADVNQNLFTLGLAYHP